MCGIIFEYLHNDDSSIKRAIKRQSRRGPDNQSVLAVDCKVRMGHNRLSILGLNPNSNQPLCIENRFFIVFNGEIYNYKELRKKYFLNCETDSDTEVLLRLYLEKGEEILSELVGMFAFVIYDRITEEWIAARDSFGIKPLFYAKLKSGGIVFASEVSAILEYGDFENDYDSYLEWKKFRRPVPGYTFYKGIGEFSPGSIMRNNGLLVKRSRLEPSDKPFIAEEFEEILRESIKLHTVSDVPIASLISGGVDSNIVALISDAPKIYTTGLLSNNEGIVVGKSNEVLKRELIERYFIDDEVEKKWDELVKYKREPIYVPNEGLIALICEQIPEKVVLTGEGADELLFGYDRIFKMASKNPKMPLEELLDSHYVYADIRSTQRMREFIAQIGKSKLLIDALEDFFIEFHLSCLLRRMDFASMFASKEARVPFVNRQLFGYMYRRPYDLRCKNGVSKAILKDILLAAGVTAPVNAPKVGFETKDKGVEQKLHYEKFQKTIMESCGW